MSIAEKKLSFLVQPQFTLPSQQQTLLAKGKIEILISLLFSRYEQSYIKRLNSEKQQAFCFAKVVYICLKVFRKNNFNKINFLAPYLIGLRSLQGKSIYEVIFINITENEFLNFLDVLHKEPQIYSLIKADPLYLKHQIRLSSLISQLGIPPCNLKRRINFFVELASDPLFWSMIIIAKNKRLQPLVEVVDKYKLPFLEAFLIKSIASSIEQIDDHYREFLNTDSELKKLNGHHPFCLKKAIIFIVETMGYQSKEKIALLVRIVNEGWKRVIDDSLESGVDAVAYKPILPLPTSTAIQKKSINLEEMFWEFDMARVAYWFLEDSFTLNDIEEQLKLIKDRLRDRASAAAPYDLHVNLSQELCGKMPNFKSLINSAFDQTSICLHIHDDYYSSSSGQTPAQTEGITPAMLPTLAQQEEPDSCPSYFDPTKMINEKCWAVTFIGYSQLVIEGIHYGDRFRKIVNLSQYSLFSDDRNWTLKGQYFYFRYVASSRLSVRDLGEYEQIPYERKSETWICKSKKMNTLFQGNLNLRSLPFSFFGRKSIVSREPTFFLINDPRLLEIYQKNPYFFFDLVEKAFKYRADQLKDDHFNPFLGDYSIDAKWILERWGDPKVLCKAIVNDIGTYLVGPSNTAYDNPDNHGRKDPRAVEFKQEMEKADHPVFHSPYRVCRDLLLSLKEDLKVLPFETAPRQVLQTFVDEEDWNELARHIVLVHAVHFDRFVDFFSDQVRLEEVSIEDRCLFVIKKLLTKDGVMVKELDCKERQFKKELNFRPHIHWSWNQLVQGHGNGNNWEESLIAVLEPLSTFEKSKDAPTAFGIAPYDTFTIGSHKLSPHSTLIIPDVVEKEIRQYLTGFQGKIVCYKFIPGQFFLREVILKKIKELYPETWHVVNHRTGHKVGGDVIETPAGYPEITCIEKTNGERIVLIEQEGYRDGQVKARALQSAVKAGKFIGLHQKSLTYWLENQTCPVWNDLKPFKENPASIKGKSVFAGYTEDRNIPKLLVLQGLVFRDKMCQFPLETAAWEVGDYIWKECVFADVMSICYTRFPEVLTSFSPYELHLMISEDQIYLDSVLHQLLLAIEEKSKPVEIFQKYIVRLEVALRAMLLTRQTLENNLESDVRSDNPDYKPLIKNLLTDHEWSSLSGNADFENRSTLTGAEIDLMKAVNLTFEADPIKISRAITQTQKMVLTHPEEEIKQQLLFLESMLKMVLKEIYYKKMQAQLLQNQNRWEEKITFELSRPKITAKEIVQLLSENSTLKSYYAKAAGVVEGYTVGQHTEMVLDLALRYRGHLEPQIANFLEWRHFILFLALHDIGKGISKEGQKDKGKSSKELELEATQSIVFEVCQLLRISSKMGYIFQALLMYDSQGDYLKGDLKFESLKEHLLTMATVSNLKPSSFYKIYSLFHMIDAASYPSLQPLFIWGQEKLEHCKGNQSLIDFMNQELMKEVS